MAEAKWHVGKKGPAKCYARKGQCPYGGDTGEVDHFDKFEDAVSRYEEKSKPKDLYPLTYPPEVDYAELEEEYGDDAYNVAQDIIDIDSEYLREEIDRQIQDSNVLYDEHGEPYNAVRIEGANMGWSKIGAVTGLCGWRISPPTRLIRLRLIQITRTVERDRGRNHSHAVSS